MARRSRTLSRARPAVAVAILLAATSVIATTSLAASPPHSDTRPTSMVMTRILAASPRQGDRRPNRPIPARERHPAALSSALVELARKELARKELARKELARKELARAKPPDATTRTPTPPQAETAVSITLDAPADLPAILHTLAGLGGTLLNHSATLLEASVPIDRLDALAAALGVHRVQPINRSRTHALTSAGVAIHGATAWQQAGYLGAGVRIGIIDGGFAGLSDRLGIELPAGVQARCYTHVGTFSTSLAPCETNAETHGTAVAETIADIAPGATLYVANPISYLDHLQTVAWMTGAGVRIINASFGSTEIFEGPGDGTSPLADSFYSLVDAAVTGGALWVNSAGNSADQGWSGPWTDANDNGWLEFSGGDEANSITLSGGETIDLAIRWSDPWGASANDYDLYLFPADGSSAVAESTDTQAGSGDPVERLTYTALTTGVYDIQVAKDSGAPVGRIQLLAQGNDGGITYQVADGTLPSPADSANPGMVSVGAVGATSPDAIEPYSSRGPTTDGRTKPDIVAVDCADTTAIPQFCGTSQSAPYVAGAAALLLQADPTLDPTRLAAALRSHTVPLGAPVPNNTFGWGRLALGAAPTTGPPPAPTPPAPGPPPLGLKAVSTPGAAMTWRGLATSGTTAVHVVLTETSLQGDAVVYRRSTDGGATFESGTLLSAVGTQAGYAAVTSVGSAVHVAWLEGDLGGIGAVALWYRSSTNGGASWGPPKPLSAVDGRAGNPGLATDGAGHVLAAWTDGLAGRVYAVTSADGGMTFGSPRAIGSTTISPFTSLADVDGLPAVAFGSGGLAYVAWSSSSSRVLLRRSADAGASWLPVQTIDALADGYSRPWLSAYGGGVMVAYGARPSRGRPALAYVRRSTDGGATWQPRRAVSASTTLGAFDPAVAARGSVVRVAYAQCTTSSCTKARLWYRQSANGGSTWSTAAALTGSATYTYPTGLAATSRILVLYDAAGSSTAGAGTAYLRIR